MERLTYHFVIYLSSILLLIVGATNYWLYKNNTERLEESLNSVAQSKLEGVTTLSAYYITHYEFELLEKLALNTVAREGVLYVSVKTADGDINLEVIFPLISSSHNQ